jgi:hypothetical protein
MKLAPFSTGMTLSKLKNIGNNLPLSFAKVSLLIFEIQRPSNSAYCSNYQFIQELFIPYD